MNAAIGTVLLDIEGTIAPIAFVHKVLFPFARRALAGFLETHWDEPAVREARRQVALDAATAEFDRAALVGHLHELMDRDAKATGLKLLQGLVWERGYASGELRSTLFDDVAPALRRWHAASVGIRIYSSGSVAAQRVFFRHTTDGDLTSLISGWYDTTSGPKRHVGSYRTIAADIGGKADGIVFVSDVPEELDAAAAAGLRTRLAVRPGNAPVGATDHARVESLDEISVA